MCRRLTFFSDAKDNLGAILAIADIFTQVASANDDDKGALAIKHVLVALMKAYEFQGCFQIKNVFNKIDLDHIILVKTTSTATVS